MESTDSHDSTTVEKKRVPMNKEHELKSDGHVNTTSDSDSHAFDVSLNCLVNMMP